MTDRIKALTVILTKEIRDDDCECIINAIKMIKGVSIVETHIAQYDDYFVEQRTKNKVLKEVYNIIKGI